MNITYEELALIIDDIRNAEDGSNGHFDGADELEDFLQRLEDVGYREVRVSESLGSAVWTFAD